MKPPSNIRALVVARPASSGGAVVICGRAVRPRRGAIISIWVEDVEQWPDAVDLAIAEGALAAQEIVAWEFARLGEAFAAAQWLRAGGVA